MSKRNNPSSLRKRFTNRRSSVPHPLTMPSKLNISMKYSEPLAFTTTTGLAYDYQFNLNSIFDPNRSGGGHQPLGHDQWATLYGRYRVDRSTVHATWLNAPSVGQMCTVLFSNSVGDITNPAEAIESPFSSSKGMSTSGTCTEITRSQSLNTVTGVTESIYRADDRYQAAFGASPSETIIAHIITFTPTSASINVNVVVTYYLTLFDHLQLTVS